MGPITFRRLLDRFGSARAVVEEADRDALAQVRGLTRAVAEAVLNCRPGLERAARLAETLQQRGVSVVRMGDAEYPQRLHDLLNPPPLLYMVGQIGPEDQRSVSIVGTTKPSDRGRALTEQIAARFAKAGVTIVSGYAHGIDAAAHRGAFGAGGRSILCVPYGLRQFRSRPDFPPLAEIARRGAVISECPPDQEWSAAAAVARDRIIAALGAATFVAETRPRGGTMHTVRAAEQLRRPLYALKYSDPPESARGNSILIARGAGAITMLKDVDEIVAGQ